MSPADPRSADTIYTGGTVLTVDADDTVAEAVATAGDRIVAVGSVDELRTAAPGAQVVEVSGATIVPGLHDPHVHPLHIWEEYLNATVLRPPPLGDVTSFATMLERLQERVDATPPGDWVIGSRYDELTFTDDPRVPTRHDLDRLSSRHPILLVHRSGHTNVVNSVALELAGLTRDTPDPSGGVIGRDADGVPTGVLEYQSALSLVRRHMPHPTPEQLDETMAAAGRLLLAAGVTAVHDAAMIRRSEVEAYRRAIDGGIWPIRTTIMPFHAVAFDRPGRAGLDLDDLSDGWLRRGPVKFLADGSVPGRTGWLKEAPYLGQCGCGAAYGGPAMEPEAFIDTVRRVHRSGGQVAVHAGGDGAIDLVLEAVAAAQADEPRPDARHRIEHCHVVRPDQLDRIAELGITISFFVSHTYFWGDRYIDSVLGPERAARIDPVREALDRGIRCSLHSDAPHVPAEPITSMAHAVHRMTYGGRPIGPENEITAAEALRCVTVDAAYQAFDDDRLGSIEPGKLADLTMLSHNPLEIDPARLRELVVERVVTGGATRYSR